LLVALVVLSAGFECACEADRPERSSAPSIPSAAIPSTQNGTLAPTITAPGFVVPPVLDSTPLDTAEAPDQLTGCPSDMVLVDGEFCPVAEQVCLDPAGAQTDEQAVCREFQAPSRCLSRRRELKRFCIDRYEWPNQARTKPRVLTQWSEAKQLCDSLGKRLCEETEWLFACEGEAMLPYTYGYSRDPTTCVVDRLYVQPGEKLQRWDACLENATCRERFARLDQREPAGAARKCKSPFGVFDMNGNVNEWIEVPGARYPNRSGLKGGWWGPVRNRCRPTVRFHKEDDWGYEVGFRCCQDASP
jgi:formylglycine-generating enzyme